VTKREKRVFGMVAALGLFAGVGFSIFTPPLYEGRAAFKIGKVNVFPELQTTRRSRPNPFNLYEEKVVFLRPRPIEIPHEIEEELHVRFRVREAMAGLVEPPYVYEIVRLDQVIELRARGREIKALESFLAEIMSEIVDRHDHLYESQKQFLEEYIWEVSKDLKIDGEAVQRSLQKLIDYSAKREGKVEKAVIERIVRDAIFVYAELGQVIMPQSLTRTKIVLPPTVAPDALQPNPLAYILGCCLAGSMLGLILVVIWRLPWKEICSDPLALLSRNI